jgi:hypothetical protein
VSLVRLASTTHGFDENQRFVPLAFTVQGGTVRASVPDRPGVCVPGHYMLFVLSTAGVPSVARIVRVPVPDAGPDAGPAVDAAAEPAAPTAPLTATRERATGTRVTVGLTAQCPYGLAACWGGAYEALTALPGVAAVAPAADATDSTAEVYLRDAGLPDLDAWPAELARSANGSYAFRGIELTLDGTVEQRDGDLVLTGPRPDVRLRPLAPGDELAWDLAARRPRPATAEELAAHERVRGRVGTAVRVTGPASTTAGAWSLAVRVVEDA